MEFIKFVFKFIGFIVVTFVIGVAVLVGCVMIYLNSAETFSTEFTLTEEDIVEFEEAVAKYEECVLGGTNSIMFLSYSQKLRDCYYRIETQYSISYINYCKDTKDPKATADYEFAFKAYSDARSLYNETLRNILLSGGELAETLFAGWSQEQKDMLLNDNENVYRLGEENENILLEYRNLDFSSEGWEDTVDGMYYEIVKNNNEIAKEYGYSNYYDYASKLQYLRNYTPKEREEFRAYVKEYIVPLYVENYERLEALLASADEETLAEYAELMESDYPESETVRNYISEYINGYNSDRTLEELGYYMNAMFKDGRAVFADGENAKQGAFTTYLSAYGEPVAFFGRNYQNALTIVHEMGHYAAFSISGAANLPMDYCEVHSQANEWMFIASLDGKLDPEVYELFMLSRLTRSFMIIILATSVDECEERIYTMANADSPDDYAAVINEVMLLYGEDIAEDLELFAYFRRVAPENPVYYLSYALSEVEALKYFIAAEEDYKDAQKDYYSFMIESFDLLSGEFGLESPFEEETFVEFKEMFAKDSDDGDTEGEKTAVYTLFLESCLPAA